VLTEGFDAPHLKSVFCRPSCKSVTLQMAGRAFRKHPTAPIKQIVQCKRTKWPFIRTAAPVSQYILNDEGNWRSLTLNENIDKIGCKVLRTLAGIRTTLPKYFNGKAGAGRKKQKFGGGGDN
jgi:hypothetical protein